MSSQNPTSKLDKILADAQRNRETSYREKALKMYPHICGRCGRAAQRPPNVWHQRRA